MSNHTLEKWGLNPDEPKVPFDLLSGALAGGAMLGITEYLQTNTVLEVSAVTLVTFMAAAYSRIKQGDAVRYNRVCEWLGDQPNPDDLHRDY